MNEKRDTVVPICCITTFYVDTRTYVIWRILYN